MTTKFITVDANGSYPEVFGFASSEFIESSAGAADGGKPIVTDASGLIDASLINFSTIDHGSLTGLGDDDHVQYSLIDGSRDFTGVVAYSLQPTFSDDLQIITKKYADDLFERGEWQDSVLDADILDPTPLTPSTGDRYLINGVGAGAWSGQDDKIATWNGTSWDFTDPTTGMRVGSDDEPNVAFYLYGGSSWEAKLVESTTASTGLTKVGQDIQIDPAAAGDGLGFSAGVLGVNVDDSSIEITTDSLNVKDLGITNAMLAGGITDAKLASDYIQTTEVDDVTIEFAGGNLNVKDDGINALKIDFGLGVNQVSASDLPIADSGNFTNETNVEGAIQEIYGELSQRGVIYVSGGVTKGDLCFVSANDTASTYASITSFAKGIGLANATVGAGNDVKVLSNDTVITGVLSGATAGDVYYWDGTSHVAVQPSTNNAYIIQTGIAKNATDLHVEVRPIKRNLA